MSQIVKSTLFPTTIYADDTTLPQSTSELMYKTQTSSVKQSIYTLLSSSYNYTNHIITSTWFFYFTTSVLQIPTKKQTTIQFLYKSSLNEMETKRSSLSTTLTYSTNFTKIIDSTSLKIPTTDLISQTYKNKMNETIDLTTNKQSTMISKYMITVNRP